MGRPEIVGSVLWTGLWSTGFYAFLEATALAELRVSSTEATVIFAIELVLGCLLAFFVLDEGLKCTVYLHLLVSVSVCMPELSIRRNRQDSYSNLAAVDTESQRDEKH